MVEAPSIIFLIQKFSSARNNSVFNKFREILRA